MHPVKFKEVNRVWAVDQPEYLPLPAYTNERETISCWKLTWWERVRVLFTGCLWLRQVNFGKALQPQSPSVHRPFAAVLVVQGQHSLRVMRWLARAEGKRLWAKNWKRAG